MISIKWFVASVFLLNCCDASVGMAKTQVRQEKNVTFVDLDEKDSDRLILQWNDQAISGVMAALASKKIKYLTKMEKEELENCSKHADSIEKHAKCILPAIHASKYRRPSASHVLKPEEAQNQIKKLIPKAFDTTRSKPVKILPKKSRFEFLKQKSAKFGQRKFGKAKILDFGSMKSAEKFRERSFSVNAKSILSRKKQKIGPFVLEHGRRKRAPELRTANSYQLLPSQSRLTPIGSFAKFLMGEVMKQKNKTMSDRIPWQNMVERIKVTGQKRKEMKRRHRLRNEADPLEEMAFKALETRNLLPQDAEQVLDKLIKDPSFRKSETEKVKENPVKRMMMLMREGVKLGYMAAGRNVSNFDDKNIKVASPRFLSITPENQGEESDDSIDLLSPSLFSLHSQGSGLERELSIPNLVRSFTSADQQQWLDLIFEASGVQDAIEKTEKAIIEEEFQLNRKKRYAEKMVDDHGNPLFLTPETASRVLGPVQDRRNDVFDQLARSYTPKQLQEMKESGYAILNKAQIQLLYGSGSVHADSALLKRLLAMNESEIHSRVERDVVALAQGRSRRQKRTILLSPFVGANIIFDAVTPSQPIILSPILFTNAIGSPAVLGPIILGPWLFLPLILSPRILSPAILNPFLFVPIVLSPLTLHPAILCPGLFNPIVLSPLLLTPFILSPQVFTPLILSPLCLSPFILNPTVGGPVILSPFVLTPVIYSPLALFALVLSPNALSPLVESKLIMAEVVLSPSWLS